MIYSLYRQYIQYFSTKRWETGCDVGLRIPLCSVYVWQSQAESKLLMFYACTSAFSQSAELSIRGGAHTCAELLQ